MLSDNIRILRKQNKLSQDELAEKLGVSRQSVSLWETGQTQPTIDNIIALSKIFGVSSDVILGNDAVSEPAPEKIPEEKEEKKKNKRWIVLLSVIALLVILAVVIVLAARNGKPARTASGDRGNEPVSQADVSQTSASASTQTTEPTSGQIATTPSAGQTTEPPAGQTTEPPAGQTTEPPAGQTTEPPAGQTTTPATGQTTTPPAGQTQEPFDLFSYCKDFAIKIGTLNGDFVMYQQPSTLYGGYENEYFSLSYWGDSNMVEFCLHCPLDQTYSVNFYLRMRGGYDGTYEYLTSRYFRTDGTSLRSATGRIDPAAFSDSYPLYCDKYEGSATGQNEFMEESRVGMCDLIRCLKHFVAVENMDCSFSDFGFKNF